MSVGTFQQPNNLTQNSSLYKGNIDSSIMSMNLVGGGFAPHQSSTPNMTVTIDPGNLLFISGFVLTSPTLSSQSVQISGSISAPISHPRIDRIIIDSTTGAIATITGVESTTPSAPSITAGYLPIAQVYLVVNQSIILNSNITDERCLMSTLTLSTYPTITPGNATTLAGALTSKNTTSLSYVKLKEIVMNVSGTFRISFNLSCPDGNGIITAYGRIYKNGIAYGTEQSTLSTIPTNFTQDLSFVNGDLVQLYVKVNNSSQHAYIDTFLIQCSDYRATVNIN
jgi:hypothetical protein